ncbi:hypothetical protein TREES_T100014231 [Tupaia chinensis]|uniref:Uncharacterized protein n=1 Tax=Tupaia chinensis TaxID=246437 RepID=L9KKZ2_TUPCH|nr:hypothetical protein TREES_T100014231 [Tupaia chinensis]
MNERGFLFLGLPAASKKECLKRRTQDVPSTVMTTAETGLLLPDCITAAMSTSHCICVLNTAVATSHCTCELNTAAVSCHIEPVC